MGMVSASLVHVFPDFVEPCAGLAVLGVAPDGCFGQQASARLDMPGAHVLAADRRRIATSTTAEPQSLSVLGRASTGNSGKTAESLANHVDGVKTSGGGVNTSWHQAEYQISTAVQGSSEQSMNIPNGGNFIFEGGLRICTPARFPGSTPGPPAPRALRALKALQNQGLRALAVKALEP